MVKKEKRINTSFFVVLSSFIVNLVIGIILLFGNKDEYLLISIIPLSYSLLSIILFSGFKFFLKKKSITMILLLFYLRMVIIPFLIIAFGNYSTMNVNIFFNHSVETIFIMAYEYLCILVLIILNNKKINNTINYNVEEKLDNKTNEYNFSLIYLIFFSFLIFLMFILLKYPYSRTSIKFLFSSSSLNDSINNYNNSILFKNSMSSVLYWLFNLIYQLFYILLPFVLIHIIYRTKLKEKNKIILSFVFIFLVGCFTTEEKAISIFVMVTSLLYLIELYPLFKKRIVKYLIFIFMAAIFGILLKNGIGHDSVDFLKIIQAYFSGPYFINVGFNIESNFNFNKIIPDILSSLAYLKYFFNNTISSNDLYNIAYYGNDIQKDKIMPMIVQSYYYFGMIFSPIISIITAKIAIKTDLRIDLKKHNSPLKKYIKIYLIVLLSCSIITYNFTILISNLTGIIIPLMIISFTEEHIKIKK